ncbi:RNA polymerase II subunit A C-terminal domain phosphatase isoform X2 [Sardina pilchardus]|uniref:RNA polymerase II subunit A C-terminal domain phosphatase isoform X2 n=1 Tax=Sardina pilchardus TaxID=27697 RepID=UPI002E0E314E
MEDPADSGGGGAAAPEGPTMRVTEIRCPTGACPLRLLEWKVKPGSFVNVDSVLALCAPIRPVEECESETREQTNRLPEKKVKSDRAGVVKELCCQLGQVISPGGVIARIEECSHPIVMKGLCAECGKDLAQLQNKNGRQQAPLSTANVSMVHSVPELMVSSEQAELLGREDQQRLHRNRKLVLMVDLDQTLIHTTEQHCRRLSNKGIFHFQLGRGEPMLHTRLRPHCKDFLEKIAKLYELHVFTFGSRLYAHTIAGFLDPEKKLFSHRILSRDECIDPFSKTGNLRNLFPSGDSMVCIIDDREDVWKFAPNLVTVKKYVYFQGTGDINAPPGSREAARKGAQASKAADSTEPSDPSTASEEQSNGLRKRAPRDRHAQPPAPAPASATQGATANDRTQPDKEGAGQQAEGEAAAASRVGGEGTSPNAEETEKNSGGSGSSAQEAQRPEEEPSSEPSSSEPKEPEPTNAGSENAQSHGAGQNDLDFNLSSDSDDDSQSEAKDRSTPPAPTQPTSSTKEEDDATSASREESDAVTAEKSIEESRDHNAQKELGNGDSTEVSDKEPKPSEATAGGERSAERGPDDPTADDDEDMADEDDEEEDEEDEEDEEEEEDRDHDDHLIYLEEVLTRVHREYYARYDAYLHQGASGNSPAAATAAQGAGEPPDMRRIVPEVKGRVLVGTTVVFSGLYPTNYPMERTREFYHARALGAHVAKSLVLNIKDPECTTHLIAARAGTDKVRQAMRCKHLYVVNPDWLWGCLERWEKVEEQLYPIKEDYSKAPRSNSPAFFPDALCAPPLHPAPQQDPTPRPPPPEVRTYDPVTGKLIRRGPQAHHQPSFHHHHQQHQQQQHHHPAGPSGVPQPEPKPRPSPPEVRTYDPVTGKLIRRGPQASRHSSYGQAPGPSTSRSSFR